MKQLTSPHCCLEGGEKLDQLKVSILIPCFNAELWIKECIESALGQSVIAKEVIVVDDGSNDCSLDIIRSFGSQIRFETTPNRGGNAARNRLLEIAKGEWVQFLDADDYLKPDKIERQLQSAASSKSVDVIYSPVTCETWDGDAISDTSEITNDSNQSLEEQWIRWRVAQTGSVLWRCKSLQQIGGWNEDYPCCQDNEVTMRAIKNGLQFHYCSDAGAVYRIWSDETVCRKDPARVINHKTILIDEMLDWLRASGRLTDSHSQAAGQAFFEMARSLANSDIGTAVEYVSDRKKHGAFQVTGTAASLKYRAAYRLLGFERAERMAARMRS